jgi:hypothetical protein
VQWSAGIGREDLGAVEHETIAILSRPCLDLRHVGAAMWLGDAERGDDVAAAERRQPLPLDRVRSEAGEHGHRRAVAQKDRGEAWLRFRKLLAQQCGAAQPEAGAAIIRIIGRAHEAGFPERTDQLGREGMIADEGADGPTQLLLNEPVHACQEGGLVFAIRRHQNLPLPWL